MASYRKNARNGLSPKKETHKQNGVDTNENSGNKVMKNSLWKKLVDIDEKCTAICAVCAHENSPLSLLRPVMKLIEVSCHGVPWLLVTTLFLLSVHKAHHVEMLVNLLYGLILDLIVIGILKTVFRRSRPAHNKMDMFATVSIDNYSFPSGHASRAGMLACFFFMRYLTCPTKSLLVLTWSLIVTASRVALGRHHIVDVVCGYGVGIAEYLLLVYLWVPVETCLSWLELYFSHFHL
ncbi:polyisoprenoid diphosphate/phosphate phosphohydrolase PLPP6-like [Dreissena polymorpha]|uniref:Phosphatidic acid phosphatase type 2/haloperoxidase domain-containing protein n=1 Tax=Dreissena polymorpha TaxID=45954 RepID=A0A9D4JA08_DREPO|nr:polyisoprenoid diphosphate/phosphate phosphohydrolase PLPP6-like [Dreissena polymorpha]KAH3801829.1 hypothetical protein DPMN_155491 [Dreissena polymorpha]